MLKLTLVIILVIGVFVDLVWGRKVLNELKTKTENLPFIQNRKIIHVLFLKRMPPKKINEVVIISPDDVIAALR